MFPSLMHTAQWLHMAMITQCSLRRKWNASLKIIALIYTPLLSALIVAPLLPALPPPLPSSFLPTSLTSTMTQFSAAYKISASTTLVSLSRRSLGPLSSQFAITQTALLFSHLLLHFRRPKYVHHYFDVTKLELEYFLSLYALLLSFRLLFWRLFLSNSCPVTHFVFISLALQVQPLIVYSQHLRIPFLNDRAESVHPFFKLETIVYKLSPFPSWPLTFLILRALISSIVVI